MTTALAVTDVDFANKVIELAEANPGFIYDSGDGCKYINNGIGDCIVGQAAIALGFDPELVGQHEGTSAYIMIQALLSPKEIRGFGDVGPYIRFCDNVQGAQDIGESWGDAVIMNRHYLPGEL